MSDDIYLALANVIQGEALLLPFFNAALSDLPESRRERADAIVRDGIREWVTQVANSLRVTITPEECAECLAYFQREVPAAHTQKVSPLVTVLAPMSAAHFAAVGERTTAR